jgi:hypothetical protein
LSDFFNGAVLGACISTLSFPFSVAKVQMQKNMVHQPGLSAFRAIGNVIMFEWTHFFMVESEGA